MFGVCVWWQFLLGYIHLLVRQDRIREILSYRLSCITRFSFFFLLVVYIFWKAREKRLTFYFFILKRCRVFLATPLQSMRNLILWSLCIFLFFLLSFLFFSFLSCCVFIIKKAADIQDDATIFFFFFIIIIIIIFPSPTTTTFSIPSPSLSLLWGKWRRRKKYERKRSGKRRRSKHPSTSWCVLAVDIQTHNKQIFFSLHFP